MSIILKADNISKQYRLGTVGTGTLGHDLNRWWHTVRGKEDPYLKIGGINDRSAKATEDYVWALRDINFEVQQGEVLGIIGKNGAGKSTLLKLLSRVTAPTTGSIKTKGRIASLLEIGTGFHPELTGKENIFMNGAVLGMTRSEIKKKLEEIIAFSGVEKYIDTPVKRYSSGMTVRLGFAVAAHLEPEILVVDEVLAVGDAEFQKKAIGKMQNLSTGEGRTVLFVSHNMTSVKSLCTRTIVLENGSISYDGEVDDAVHHYLKMDGQSIGSYKHRFDQSDNSNRNFRLLEVGVKGGKKKFGQPITRGDTIKFEIDIIKLSLETIHAAFKFKDDEGKILFTTNTAHNRLEFNQEGQVKYVLTIPQKFFNEGNFTVDLMITDGKQVLSEYTDILNFSIIEEARPLGSWMGKSPGALKPNFNWEIVNEMKS